MLNRVAAVVLDHVAQFELGVICEVFGTDRRADGFPYHEFTVCSPGGRPVRTKNGFSITPDCDLDSLENADLVAVPAHEIDVEVPDELFEALRRAVDRGAYVLSVCSGAFILGRAGLLDGRRCTTHWMYTDALKRRFPLADVQPNLLYVEDGPVFTSAGTAAGIDLCLHLVRKEYGSAVATKMARRMVVPPHRDGGQAQYIEMPVPPTPQAATLGPFLEWLIANLDEEFDIDDLAAKVHMAPRTFARRFRAETGTTPHDWITGQRVLLARRLLEDTDLSVEAIATRAGFGTAAALRNHFSRRVGATPQSYRTTFRSRELIREAESILDEETV